MKFHPVLKSDLFKSQIDSLYGENSAYWLKSNSNLFKTSAGDYEIGYENFYPFLDVSLNRDKLKTFKYEQVRKILGKLKLGSLKDVHFSKLISKQSLFLNQLATFSNMLLISDPKIVYTSSCFKLNRFEVIACKAIITPTHLL